MSDYLWDKSGDADPEIERLERTLEVFAQSTPPPRLELRKQPPASRGFGRSALLIAASLTLVVAGLVLALMVRRAAPGWQVTTASVDGVSTKN